MTVGPPAQELPSVLTPVLALAERVGLDVAGVAGWTTTRENGSFGLGGDEPVAEAMQRWTGLLADLATLGLSRLATAHQVHGNSVSLHQGDWSGWLRQRGVDGHVTATPGTALAVTVADCTPVFVAHPNGVAMLHAGWRGAAAHILQVGFEALQTFGIWPEECTVHLGPSICAGCYEVGSEVMSAVTGKPAFGKAYLDVRAVLAEQAYTMGVNEIDASPLCTRCDNERFFSHRAGDSGRQLGVIALLPS